MSVLFQCLISSIVCGEHKVKQAYYHVCQDCSNERGVCAKCGKTEEITERWGSTYKEKHVYVVPLLCL